MVADNLFGYKNALSTDLCIFSFKEIVQYYHSMSSNVYACFLDVFDRVNHYHLSTKLLSRNTPNIIVTFLLFWHQTQMFAIKWCNTVSTPFNVTI